MTGPGGVDVRAKRAELADLHGFADPAAGPARRAALTEHLRSWLQGIWAQALQGQPDEGLALAAVGSLGRGELGPFSDIDLVLLHSGRVLDDRRIAALADRLWYPVWDAGVRLDHSVRTVAQCRSVAATDLAATVGLLDVSAVAGDRELVAATRATVAHDWRASARKRLPQLLDALGARHARHGDVAQSLQPDLKEARGGLRDLTVLRALTETWLVDARVDDLEPARGRLLDVRDALHVVAGRARDQLTREDHDAVASVLGFADREDLLTDVSMAGRRIGHTLDAAVRTAGQAQRARVLRVGPRRPQMVPVGHGAYLSDGEVVLGAERVGDADPFLAVRVARAAAVGGHPISPRTVANLAARPDSPVPWPEHGRDAFADLLAAGPGLLPVWESLDQAGLVSRWIPPWDAVRSRPQYSPVHRHTVDRHLLETVVQAGALVRRVARPDLLLVAALLHDIGKVRGARDHSRTGAPVARALAARLGFDPGDQDRIEVLVTEHLTLMDLATRRDHSDPATVAAALAAVGADAETFELLLALSEADARAAGPAAWTDWRATLLAQLATAVRARLDRGPGAPPLTPYAVSPADRALVAGGEVVVRSERNGTSWRVDVVAGDRLGLFADTAGLLAAHGLLVRAAIVRTIDGVAANEWHVEAIHDAAPSPERLARDLGRLAAGDRSPLRALERYRPTPSRPSGSAGTASPGQARAMVVPGASLEATVVEVRAADRRGLLHDIGAALSGAGISVRSAHIGTHAGQTLDTFYLTDPTGEALRPAVVAQVVALVIDVCEGATPPA